MRKYTGKMLILLFVVVNIVLWLSFLPPDNGRRDFTIKIVSEVLASSAIILMACVLFLATKARVLEPLFGGLDRMYQAHRQTAVVALIVVYAHTLTIPVLADGSVGTTLGGIALTGLIALAVWALLPRIIRAFTTYGKGLVAKIPPSYHLWAKIPARYHLWRWFHRLIGLFFLVGIAHLLLVDSLIRRSSVVFGYVMAVSAAAILAYGYKELFYSVAQKKAAYIVQDVRKLSSSALEVTLAPQQAKLSFRSGQFLFVHFDDERFPKEPHPFTISSAPHDNHLRLAVKACGDFTHAMYAHLRAGAHAFVDGGYGMFDYCSGGKQQIWIAGGIGITPFLSWMRSFRGTLEYDIDFFYNVRVPEDYLYVEEIQQIAAQYANFRPHLSCTKQDGYLTLDNIMASGKALAECDIYFCGPLPMRETFQNQLRQKGLSTSRLHFEEFNFR